MAGVSVYTTIPSCNTTFCTDLWFCSVSLKSYSDSVLFQFISYVMCVTCWSRTVHPINSHVTVYEASGNGVGSAVLNLHHFLGLVIDPLEKVQLVLRGLVVD